MNRNNALYALAALVATALGLAACGDGTGNLLAGGGGAPEIKDTDMVHGSPDAPVTIIEYASMTCPHCATFQTMVVPQLTEEYIEPGRVSLVFREFPLDGAARMASATARCMEGDAYFAFIDLLFRNQQQWIQDFDGNQQLTQEDVEEGLAQMGRMAGMSREQTLACANDPANLALVDGNWQEGQSRYNVQSTPTFVINGNVHAGGLSYEALKGILDPMLAQ